MTKNFLICKPNLSLADLYINKMKAGKMPFTVIKTNYTTMVKGEFVKYLFFDESMSRKTLGLAMKVRGEVEKRYDDSFVWDYEKIKFMLYNYSELRPDSNLLNCLEFDINSAYLNAAFKLGLISQSTFTKINEMPKIDRLKILGSMATRRFIQEYKAGKVVSEKIETNERLRSAWFMVCYEIDKILFECAREVGNSFLFYYVDGIYIMPKKTTDADIVMNIICSHGYDFKYKHVNIRVTKKQNLIVYDNKGARPFYVRKKQIKKIIML